MARIAFHLQIKDGYRESYREYHESVPETLEAAYLDSGAGLETYSVFEADGHVFGFMEVDDPDRIKEVIDHSEAQSNWEEKMDPILENGTDIWMEEVYRMI